MKRMQAVSWEIDNENCELFIRGGIGIIYREILDIFLRQKW